jgi:hypothetical protein
MYMSAETSHSHESHESAVLRADIERLFSPELSHIVDSVDGRDIFFVKNTFRRIIPNVVPEEADDIALEDYKIKYGSPYSFFYRSQSINERFARQTIVSDHVHYSITDYAYSGGPGEYTPYVANIDMLQPELNYDERLARIIRVCLEHAGDT